VGDVDVFGRSHALQVASTALSGVKAFDAMHDLLQVPPCCKMDFSVPNLTLVGSDGHPQLRPTNYEAAPFAQYKTRQFGCVLPPHP
jgi:hypothetical protein